MCWDTAGYGDTAGHGTRAPWCSSSIINLSPPEEVLDRDPSQTIQFPRENPRCGAQQECLNPRQAPPAPPVELLPPAAESSEQGLDVEERGSSWVTDELLSAPVLHYAFQHPPHPAPAAPGPGRRGRGWGGAELGSQGWEERERPQAVPGEGQSGQGGFIHWNK